MGRFIDAMMQAYPDLIDGSQQPYTPLIPKAPLRNGREEEKEWL